MAENWKASNSPWNDPEYDALLREKAQLEKQLWEFEFKSQLCLMCDQTNEFPPLFTPGWGVCRTCRNTGRQQYQLCPVHNNTTDFQDHYFKIHVESSRPSKKRKHEQDDHLAKTNKKR